MGWATLNTTSAPFEAVGFPLLVTIVVMFTVADSSHIAGLRSKYFPKVTYGYTSCQCLLVLRNTLYHLSLHQYQVQSSPDGSISAGDISEISPMYSIIMSQIRSFFHVLTLSFSTQNISDNTFYVCSATDTTVTKPFTLGIHLSIATLICTLDLLSKFVCATYHGYCISFL